MLIYLLKSGACLAIFMAFYTFFLEKENMHVFKRYYLLGALIIAFGIQLVTFTHYIEVAPVPMVNESVESMVYYTDNIPQTPETNYLPIILWGIYWVGVLVFGVKFLMSLIQIILRIKCNPKQKLKHSVRVLLSDLVTPHTFFKYIFLNKQKFEKHEIPQEVFWHEETHAKQKHSIDVLFIELLQVIFWFNPLIYLTKQYIKMNHEFLADQAVLNRGISASNYQHILLAFSSDAAESQLANAIHYSSTRHAIGMIKKRFTVMKTKTSKRNIWLRSALLLPLLALTLYGFSEKKIVEQKIQIEESLVDAIDLYINEEGEFLLNEKIISMREIEEIHKQNNKLKVSITAALNIDYEIVKESILSIKAIGIKKITYCTSGDTAQPTKEDIRKEMTDFLLKNQVQQKTTPKDIINSNNLQLGETTVIQQKSTYWIFLNRKGHYLINDELGTLKTLEKDFKAISADKSKFKKVTFKYDVEAPKATIDQIIDLLKKYQIENYVSTASDKPSYMNDPQK